MTTTEVMKERRAALVAALRSKKYNQVRGSLERVTDLDGEVITIGFCCLGVACAVAGAKRNVTVDSASRSWIWYGTDSDSGVGALPRSVAEFYGFKTEGGVFSKFDALDDRTLDFMKNHEELKKYVTGHWMGPLSLISLNDTGCSFDAIADLIEFEPVGLFVED